jgi:endonuclease YncB( thermonuclease family)
MSDRKKLMALRDATSSTQAGSQQRIVSWLQSSLNLGMMPAPEGTRSLDVKEPPLPRVLMRDWIAGLILILSSPVLAAECIVLDGDTLTLRGTKFRLDGIDAPEFNHGIQPSLLR